MRSQLENTEGLQDMMKSSTIAMRGAIMEEDTTTAKGNTEKSVTEIMRHQRLEGSVRGHTLNHKNLS